MSEFPNKLRLKEMAEEDIYFAKRDQELIRAMHERKLAKHLKIEKNKKRKKAQRLEDKYASVTAEYRYEPRKLREFYLDLIARALKLVRRKKG